MLDLPTVSLVMSETREYELARLAIQDCIDKVNFAEVIVFTDKPERFQPLNCEVRFVHVDDASDKLGWCRSMWFDVPQQIRTAYMFLIQWDSWVWDVSMWRDEFLTYDFVGSPWWYKDGKNVGNSGFCLKSTRLARYIWKNRDRFPCDVTIEDDLLCRTYRPKLEEVGFVWAPERIAHDFAFECCRPSPTSRHFGFHALFNWPKVLDHDRLFERLELAAQSPYISSSYMMKALFHNNPEVVRELADRCGLSFDSESLIEGKPLS